MAWRRFVPDLRNDGSRAQAQGEQSRYMQEPKDSGDHVRGWPKSPNGVALHPHRERIIHKPTALDDGALHRSRPLRV